MQDALVCKPLLGDGKLPQLVSHHVLCHLHRDVVFPIMNHKPDSVAPQLRHQLRSRPNVSCGRRTPQSSEGSCMTWLGSLSEDCFVALPAGSGTRQSKVLRTRVQSFSVNHCCPSRGPYTFPCRTAGADDERRMHQEVFVSRVPPLDPCQTCLPTHRRRVHNPHTIIYSYCTCMYLEPTVRLCKVHDANKKKRNSASKRFPKPPKPSSQLC